MRPAPVSQLPSDTPRTGDELPRSALVLLPAALSAAVYLPIVRSYFFADDFNSLYHIANDRFAAFAFEPAAGHVQVVRNAIFWACYHLFGPRPSWFFATALATHVLNVALLFGVLRALTRSGLLAAFGATLWGTSPVQEGALGWYSVYGHVLATTLILAVLGDLLVTRGHPGTVSSRRVWCWCALLLVACTCFGVAVGVALLFPAVTWLLLGRRLERRAVLVLAALPLAVAALYLGLHLAWGWLHDTELAGVETLVPLLRNWPPVVAMGLHLLAAGLAGLLFGVTYRAAYYPGPLAVGLVITCTTLIVVAALRAPWVARRELCAFLLIAIGCYATVAAGRANLFLALHREMAVAATTFRYHYLASAAVTVALCGTIAHAARRPPWRAGAWLFVGWLVASAVFVLVRPHPIDHHAEARRETEGVLDTVRAQLDAAPPASTVYVENHPFTQVALLLPNNPELFPGWAALFLVFHRSDVVEGRTVRFVERDPRVLEARRAGGPIASLLVPSPHASNVSGATGGS